MRQKRAKSYRKLMSLYHINFGFRQPYQILVDADMCKAAIDNKMDLHKQLEMVLQGDVKPSEWSVRGFDGNADGYGGIACDHAVLYTLAILGGEGRAAGGGSGGDIREEKVQSS